MKRNVLALLAAMFAAVECSAANQWVVKNLSDHGTDSLRDALANSAAFDTITFDNGLAGTITLTTGPLVITNSLTIIGPSALNLTIDGNNTYQVFQIYSIISTPVVSISGLTIANGFDPVAGGGINLTKGGLRISKCAFDSNHSFVGGAICNNPNPPNIIGLNIEYCTFSRNSASGPGGGAIWNTNSAVVRIETSTFSGNNASNGFGGAILSATNCTSVISNCTISVNYANLGGGVFAGCCGSHLVGSTIIAGNAAVTSLDVNGSFISGGFNLIGNTTGSTGWGGTDQLGFFPNLASLDYNGGSTKTMALQNPSPALDKGSSAIADQRGVARPFDIPAIGNAANGSDVGAYEYQTNLPSGMTSSDWRGKCVPNRFIPSLLQCSANWLFNLRPTNMSFSASINYNGPDGSNSITALVDSSTALSDPEMMTLSNIYIGSGCSLVLSNVGTATFHLVGDLFVGDGGSVAVFNPGSPILNSLQVDGATWVGTSGAGWLTLNSGITQLKRLEIGEDFAQGIMTLGMTVPLPSRIRSLLVAAATRSARSICTAGR